MDNKLQKVIIFAEEEAQNYQDKLQQINLERARASAQYKAYATIAAYAKEVLCDGVIPENVEKDDDDAKTYDMYEFQRVCLVRDHYGDMADAWDAWIAGSIFISPGPRFPVEAILGQINQVTNSVQRGIILFLCEGVYRTIPDITEYLNKTYTWTFSDTISEESLKWNTVRSAVEALVHCGLVKETSTNSSYRFAVTYAEKDTSNPYEPVELDSTQRGPLERHWEDFLHHACSARRETLKDVTDPLAQTIVLYLVGTSLPRYEVNRCFKGIHHYLNERYTWLRGNTQVELSQDRVNVELIRLGIQGAIRSIVPTHGGEDVMFCWELVPSPQKHVVNVVEPGTIPLMAANEEEFDAFNQRWLEFLGGVNNKWRATPLELKAVGLSVERAIILFLDIVADEREGFANEAIRNHLNNRYAWQKGGKYVKLSREYVNEILGILVHRDIVHEVPAPNMHEGLTWWAMIPRTDELIQEVEVMLTWEYTQQLNAEWLAFKDAASGKWAAISAQLEEITDVVEVTTLLYLTILNSPHKITTKNVHTYLDTGYDWYIKDNQRRLPLARVESALCKLADRDIIRVVTDTDGYGIAFHYWEMVEKK